MRLTPVPPTRRAHNQKTKMGGDAMTDPNRCYNIFDLRQVASHIFAHREPGK